MQLSPASAAPPAQDLMAVVAQAAQAPADLTAKLAGLSAAMDSQAEALSTLLQAMGIGGELDVTA